MTIDGTAVIDRAAASFLVPQPPQVRVGAESQNGGTQFSLFVDDVVFAADRATRAPSV